ncbi:MAG: ATP-grasp domain-containing protein [Acidimicrobiales bacterium]
MSARSPRPWRRSVPRSPFVVVDLAQTTAGQWRVVALGDGQVSDRPTALPADQLLRHLVRALR